MAFNLIPRMFAEISRPFCEIYTCYPVSFFPGGNKENLEKGGKIIMPSSTLDQLTRRHIQYPMLFRLTNEKEKRLTHCGVLEFVAEEGKIYIPYWMMKNLLLKEGEKVKVDNISLPVASFTKFEPQSIDFVDISNPKAVLENELRNFACLTVDDVIEIRYNKKIYELRVLETKPEKAVTIIECDMDVDFAPPVGYEEHLKNIRKEKSDSNSRQVVAPAPQIVIPESRGFQVFCGTGVRLDGKMKNSDVLADSKVTNEKQKRGIPNYGYSAGTLNFIRANRSREEATEEKRFTPFAGEGFKLKTGRAQAT